MARKSKKILWHKKTGKLIPAKFLAAQGSVTVKKEKGDFSKIQPLNNSRGTVCRAPTISQKLMQEIKRAARCGH